jgi:peptidoglycan lytic transglycosylase G
VRPRLFWSILVLFVVAGGAIGAWQAVSYYYDKPGPASADANVVIPRGAGVKQVGKLLAAEGVVANPKRFRILAWLYRTDRNLKAGEYAIPAHASIREVTAVLRSGETVVRQLTVPEGLTSREVVAILDGAYGLLGEVKTTPPEGSLLPETYRYSYGDTRTDMIRRMSRAMDDELDLLWAGRAADVPFHAPDEAVILASIVEKETAVPAERSRIAGVFINRLKRGMRLQSDPTVAYGLEQAGPLGRALTRDDIDTANPYNTYQINGLPPGPIANPGKDSLYAVLHPMATEELYFVADGTGGHSFAKTLDEHNQNVRKWRQLRTGR